MWWKIHRASLSLTSHYSSYKHLFLHLSFDIRQKKCSLSFFFFFYYRETRKSKVICPEDFPVAEFSFKLCGMSSIQAVGI